MSAQNVKVLLPVSPVTPLVFVPCVSAVSVLVFVTRNATGKAPLATGSRCTTQVTPTPQLTCIHDILDIIRLAT